MHRVLVIFNVKMLQHLLGEFKSYCHVLHLYEQRAFKLTRSLDNELLMLNLLTSRLDCLSQNWL